MSRKGRRADHDTHDAVPDRLAAAEARFYNIIERSADGMVVLDDEDRIQYANPAAGELFGHDPDDLVGSPFGQPVIAGDRTEIDLVGGDGPGRVAELRVASTEWEGESARLVSLRDITDRKKAEERERELIREQAARTEAEAAAKRNEFLARISESLTSSLDVDRILREMTRVVTEDLGDVCLVDVDDRHGPLRRLAGARRDFQKEVLVRDLDERLVQPPAESLEGRVFRTGRSELVRDIDESWLERIAEEMDELQALRGLEPCSLMMVTLLAGSLRWGVMTVLSCDPEVRYEEADLELLEEVARRAGIALENARLFRLAQDASRAKSDFVAIVSHELRTPLSAIEGYVGLLEEGIGGPLTETQREYVSAVGRSAEHLLRLIEQIITFARLEGDHEHLDLEEVELKEFLEETASLARPLATRSGLPLEMVLPTDGCRIVTDGRKLSQVVINLLTNAIKFTDDGTVRLEAEVSDGETVIRVRDTGIGIPHDKLTEIFEPFRQIERPRTRKVGGTGIGLSLVRRLTRLMGGEVAVESEEGRGTTFTVRLPRELPSGGGDSATASYLRSST